MTSNAGRDLSSGATNSAAETEGEQDDREKHEERGIPWCGQPDEPVRWRMPQNQPLQIGEAGGDAQAGQHAAQR